PEDSSGSLAARVYCFDRDFHPGVVDRLDGIRTSGAFSDAADPLSVAAARHFLDGCVAQEFELGFECADFGSADGLRVVCAVGVDEQVAGVVAWRHLRLHQRCLLLPLQPNTNACSAPIVAEASDSNPSATKSKAPSQVIHRNLRGGSMANRWAQDRFS